MTITTSPGGSPPASAETDFALTLDDVTKRFGRILAVDGISLQVPRGSIYGFIGPNGAGKTTVLRMIMSILYPDTGRIRVLGHANAEAVKDRLGYLPEEKGLYKNMTSIDLIAYFGRLKGLSKKDARERAAALMTKYGLGEWIDTKTKALSKGMGQKVQILATLIHDPELVILDEPFSGLDPVNVEVVRSAILEMKRAGKTVIFSTHVMEQAEKICDAILLINRGRKVLDGPLAEVKSGGPRTIVLDYDGDGSVLRSLPGVDRVNDSGKQAELTLREGTNPQELLRLLMDRLTIRRFDTREPSLHEIFIRAVGGNSDA